MAARPSSRTTAPLRVIGGIALGPAAMNPSSSLVTAAVTGVAVHMALSMVYGVAFALGVARSLHGPETGGLVVAGILFGLALWVVNFYLIGPAAAWTWFAAEDGPGRPGRGPWRFLRDPLALRLAFCAARGVIEWGAGARVVR